MTNERANEILRTKYPNGKIFNKNFDNKYSTQYSVMFDTNGKVYNYSGSYAEVLNKLGFNVLYKHRVDYINSRIAELANELADGGFEDEFGFYGDEDFHILDESEIKEREEEIASLNKELANAEYIED